MSVGEANPLVTGLYISPFVAAQAEEVGVPYDPMVDGDLALDISEAWVDQAAHTEYDQGLPGAAHTEVIQLDQERALRRPNHAVLVFEPDAPEGRATHRRNLYAVLDAPPDAQDLDTAPAESIVSVRLHAVQGIGGLALGHANVIRMDQLRGEDETQRRYARLLGRAVNSHEVENPSGETQRAKRSSLDIMHDASKEKEGAFDALLIDARTHVYEIFGGVGETMSVELDIDEEGNIIWAGQTTEDRQYQVLTNYRNVAPVIQEAVHAEGMTGLRLEDRIQDGQLDGKRVFEFSAVPQATQSELSEWGYFLNSIACSIRSTRLVGDGVEVSSAFLAGVDQRTVKPQVRETKTEEAARHEQALEMRFDITVLRKIYEYEFGIENAGDMSPAELLDTPIVTDEEFDVIDMVMVYDRYASKEMGEDEQAFFGSVELWQQIGSPEGATRAHYERHIEQREERHQDYEALCVDIVEEQIRRHAEARTPKEAVELKRKVVLELTVDHAIENDAVDADFGRVSNAYVHGARQAIARGDRSTATKLKAQAQATARDGSCPPPAEVESSGKAGKKDGEKNNPKDEEDDFGSLYFECPHCHQVNKRPRAKSPKDFLKACKYCKTSVQCD